MNRCMVQPWVLPSGPLLPTCSWKNLRSKPLTLPPTLHLWSRFVGDTFVIQEAEQSQHFLHHINTLDPNIQFTVEEPHQHGSLPFLDTKVTPGLNITLSTTGYRKPTCTDQYLHWNSSHFITAQHSIYNNLAHRAKVVSSDQHSLHLELEHISMALQNCHFPKWALKFNADNTTTMKPTQQTKKTPTPPTAMEPTSTTTKTST